VHVPEKNTEQKRKKKKEEEERRRRRRRRKKEEEGFEAEEEEALLPRDDADDADEPSELFVSISVSSAQGMHVRPQQSRAPPLLRTTTSCGDGETTANGKRSTGTGTGTGTGTKRWSDGAMELARYVCLSLPFPSPPFSLRNGL
jgi:hypothetical protein